MATAVLIDVDTGIDDALALLYAIAHPDLDVAAVTCVSGNVAVSQVVINTCLVLGVAGAPICPSGLAQTPPCEGTDRARGTSMAPTV